MPNYEEWIGNKTSIFLVYTFYRKVILEGACKYEKAEDVNEYYDDFVLYKYIRIGCLASLGLLLLILFIMTGNMLYKKPSIKDVSTRSVNAFIFFIIFYILWNLSVVGSSARFIPHYYWLYHFDELGSN